MAPALLSIGIKDRFRWRLITSLAPPTSSPPMNTAGTAGLHPSLERACSMSLPLGISSISWTVGLTPKSLKRVMMVWHMQHVLLLKITTDLSDANVVTLSIMLLSTQIFWWSRTVQLMPKVEVESKKCILDVCASRAKWSLLI